MNTNAMMLTPFALVLAFAVAQNISPRPSGGIIGIVRYPDGTPAEGASVTATTECKEAGEATAVDVKEIKTSNDGSFYVPPLSGCNRVRLNAQKTEDLWMKTGRGVFYEKDNGTAPLVEAPWSGSPATTEIKLGNRGALVSFRVWDMATNRFIWAELNIVRLPEPGAKFGSTQIATRRDGGSDTLLLPAGQYEVSIEQYTCGEKDYFTSAASRETLAVVSGQRIAEDISVDVRLIKPISSFNNPGAKPCIP